MRPLPALLLLLSGLCGIAGGGSPAASQPAATPQGEDKAGVSERFIDVVDVEVVNIDVWVTDKSGNPVAGLEKKDFVVHRDGMPVEVANFYAVSNRRPVTPPDEDRDNGARTSPERQSLPGEQHRAEQHRLWIILFIDNYNIDPNERNRVLPALKQFLQQTLRDGDRAMLASYDRSLKVLHPFTTEARELYSALEELEDNTGHAVARKRQQKDTLELIDKARDSSQALGYARQFAEEQMDGVERTTQALRQLIESLAGLPGRKALIHVSSGVPMLAGEGVFHAVAERFNQSEAYSQIPHHDTSRRFERVSRDANAQRVVFHTLDAGGLRGMEFGAAEYGGFVQPRLRTTLDSVVPENLQSPLRLMASETGGQAILNRNEVLPALEKVAEDFRSFYSLGILSTGGDVGRYHEVKVRLRERRGDLRLRHRAGYRGKDTETRTRESLRSALLYSHQRNPLNVQITWGNAQPHGNDGHYLLPIRLHIPLQSTVLLPTGDGKHEARLKLFVGAVGDDGSASSIDSAPVGVRLADEHVEAAKQEALVHTHKLLLSRGRKKVGVAILDLFGRESSVITQSVQIGPASKTK